MVDHSALSVVVPVYNEESNIPELHRRLAEMLDGLDFERYEVLFISDGSTDRSESLIEQIAKADSRFKGVFLTRNFGHQAAVSIGLDESSGGVVAVIDGDLQDPPEQIPKMIAALDDGADVAYGVRRRRKEPVFKRIAYWLFYRFLRAASSTDIFLDAGDFSCMTRRVVDAMKALPETRRFVRGLRAWVGFRQVGVEYEREARFAGTPKYGLVMLFGLAYDGIFAFSSLPVKLMQLLGFATAFLAGIIGFVYLVLAFVADNPRGFPTLMVSVWFLGGIQLLCFGLLGEYVYRTFDESRRRPVALIRRAVGFDSRP